MGKFSSYSQDTDGGRPQLRRRRKAPGPAPVVMVSVQRIGRHTTREYCSRCGQKRRVCKCGGET